MSDISTPLGAFSKLPHEVRERIWLHFIPTGQDFLQDTPSRMGTQIKRTCKADFSIIYTSKALSSEVTDTIYHRSTLEFDIESSPHRTRKFWIAAYFKPHHYLLETHRLEHARWILESREDAISRGFGHLPLDKIGNVTVNLYADLWDTEKLFGLREKVASLSHLFNGAPAINSLTIKLLKRNGNDWYNSHIGGKIGSYVHDMAIAPFCSLQNVERISLKTHSNNLDTTIDWTNTKRLVEVVLNKSWRMDDYVQFHLARDWFILQKKLWYGHDGIIMNDKRLGLFKDWFTLQENGEYRSAFEDRIERIANYHPDIIRQHDPRLDFISTIHGVMVCLYEDRVYNYYKQGYHCECRELNPDVWDRESWDRKFRHGGIPPFGSYSYHLDIRDHVSRDKYLERLRKGGLVTRMIRLLRALGVRDEDLGEKIPPVQFHEDLGGLFGIDHEEFDFF